MTIKLPDGEICQGRWAILKGGEVSPPDMAEAWDIVYGSGYYRSTVLGSRLHVQSVLTGSTGTTLHVELYRKDNPESLKNIAGVARDDKGNIYKVAI